MIKAVWSLGSSSLRNIVSHIYRYNRGICFATASNFWSAYNDFSQTADLLRSTFGDPHSAGLASFTCSSEGVYRYATTWRRAGLQVLASAPVTVCKV